MSSNTSPSGQHLSPQRALPRVIWLVLAMGIFAGLFVLSQRVPLWATGMFYGFRQPLTLPGGVVVPLLLSLQCGAAWMLWQAAQKACKKREAGWLSALCTLMLLANLALHAGEEVGLARLSAIVVNPASGGYYYAAFDADKLPEPDKWLRDYPQLMHGHHHVETHPPGGVALMRWLREKTKNGGFWMSVPQTALMLSPGNKLSDLTTIFQTIGERPYQDYDSAAAWWAGFILILCAALLPLPTYALARPLTGPGGAAGAASLVALVPSLALLSPALDALTALCAATALALCVHGLLKSKPMLCFAGGLVAGVGLFFSFALGATLAIIGCYFTWQAARHQSEKRHVLKCGAAVLAGALLVVFFLALRGVDWLTIYKLTHQFQAKVMTDYNRPARLWMWFNLVDFFYFVGLPACVLGGATLWKRKHEDKSLNDPVKVRWEALVFSTIGVLLLINFGANVWAESARIWMLFVPPLMVGAGWMLHKMTQKSPAAFWIVMAAQAAQWLAMAASLNVWSF
ncbi:MAG TPA: hypothetical protein VGB77_21750 [Abditibacteriaceae bacterium]